MQTIISFDLDIQPEQQGTYFTVPFEMPENIGALTLTYQYGRHANNEVETSGGLFYPAFPLKLN